jgi:S1-C subfamily serine protease
MSELNGRQVGELSEALRDAFLPDALDELLLVKLNSKRYEITMANDYRTRVFWIIVSADAAGWVFDLVVAAREARPRNAALHAVAADLGLSTAPSSLERIISASVPFVDIATWRAQLGALEGQVCRVEVPSGEQTILGTGFLVAADLCLTNYHVVQGLIEGTADPIRTLLRFDFRRTADGKVINDGTCFSLAETWLVAARPPSAADSLPDDRDRLPAKDELDFALLRIRDTPGAAPIGRVDQLVDVPIRGWVNRVGSDGYESGNPLFMLQHPEGAPLKLSFGTSIGVNANATRLRHRVNSERGSSGSPCFNARLELVGLHHAGDPNFDPAHNPQYNSAIPIHAVLDYLENISIDSKVFQPSGEEG